MRAVARRSPDKRCTLFIHESRRLVFRRMVNSPHVRRSYSEGRIDLCRRAPWTGWLGDRPPTQGRRVHQHPRRDPTAARSARSGGCERLVPGEPARVRLPRRGHRRRNPGQQHASGGVHLRQPDDPRHGCRGESVNGVKRLLYLGSSCIYPRDCPQPIREESC